ncbi:FecR family protein [Mucilaginibacter pocheonensis]|uniref:Ferric-dicitrate binding protein FerR (Iron transport regulator) n=1 Tax=Mucilaginibacter pocheonensis TaxID=398050 RepID=A0ABU1T4A4_9SPHI|nr:FecR family protein [Mucilaginibacter pocheonensis]MDR6940193.1 ferric-dicitrate binding protein FerR (iron transport regulator) [Mucilaginibacter pocheonensis]
MDEPNKQYFIQILTKYRLGNATQEEIKFLESYYNLFDLNDDLITDENEADYLHLKDAIKANVDERIAQYTKKPVTIPSGSGWIRYAVAASILLFLSVGTYFFVRDTHKANNSAANTYKGIVPGTNKATLTLANGTTISLDDATNGQIAKQAGVKITKTADGQIVYQADATMREQAVQNTVTTPKGGQYKIILPDGTNVWLNAASSITYPTVFKGIERQVTLSGEGYFEVTKNKAMPFRVKSALQTIEVLGTHFNINAYADEALVKTTLLEGSVKVTSATNSILIVPGEQAVINRAGNGDITKQQVNLDKEVAWKNGVFSFANEDIRGVMRQVSRWYNIDVVYEGDMPTEKFFGEISRSSNLTDVFRILELNNMRFAVQGKTVKVSYGK